jgi:hypothetical protein
VIDDSCSFAEFLKSVFREFSTVPRDETEVFVLQQVSLPFIKFLET